MPGSGLEESGLLHNPAKQCLVGSSATMRQCMNYLAELGFAAGDELIKIGFSNPLRLIDMEPGAIPAGRGLHYDVSRRSFIPAA